MGVGERQAQRLQFIVLSIASLVPAFGALVLVPVSLLLALGPWILRCAGCTPRPLCQVQCAGPIKPASLRTAQAEWPH